MLLLSGGTVYHHRAFEVADVLIGDDGRIAAVGPSLVREDFEGSVIQAENLMIVPGFVDVHVHLREPGFSYKETIYSGTMAAAAGGYTCVCPMPNLKPVPDGREGLDAELEAIRRSAKTWVLPYGAITAGEHGKELADMAAMAPDVIGFSDDGFGVQSEDMMRRAMLEAKRLSRPIVAHCEDMSYLKGGWAVHAGRYAKEHDLPGNDPRSEWTQVKRDIDLVRETGCQYHVCHISTRESVDLVRRAKAEGLPVTCETAPHYLLLTEDDLQDDGRFRMNPPIRTEEDRAALIEGLNDGTVDCIATDHAPHSAEEKSRGLRGSANGVVGLECAFPVVYTGLVLEGKVPLERVLDALITRPREIFALGGGTLSVGEAADLTLLDLNRFDTVDPTRFRSLGRATPFAGWGVHAGIAMTIVDGEIVYADLHPGEEVPF